MENNNKSNISLIIFFALILVFIFFMPNIIKLFDKDPVTISPNEESKKTHVYTPVEENQIYSFTNDLSITYDGVTIKNFDVTDGFGFELINNKNTSLTTDDHYFLELYDNDETLLERLYLYIDKTVTPNAKKSFKFSAINFNKIKLVKKAYSDYPFVSVTKNNQDEYALTCTGNDTYTYIFDENMKLTQINYSYSEAKTDGFDYMNHAISYKNKAIELDTINGIDATYQEGLNNFNFLAIYYLSSITDQHIYNNKIYPLNTESKVIGFEMNSQEYICK